MSTTPGRIVTAGKGTPFAGWDGSRPVAAPLALHATPVLPQWADYNDHMTESAFLLAFGESTDAFFRYIGIDEAYRAAGRSVYTLDTRIRNLREARVGDPLALTLQLLDRDAKRLHVFHAMINASTREMLAVAEQVLAHVDMAAARTLPFPADIAARIEAVAAAHADLPVPDMVGRPLGLRR